MERSRRRPEAALRLPGVTTGQGATRPIPLAAHRPEQFHLDELVRSTLRERHDLRKVIADPHARYFGAELQERTLVPAANARLAETRFEHWLSQSTIGHS